MHYSVGVVLTCLFSFFCCSLAGVRGRGHHDKENDSGESAAVRGEALQLGSHDGQKDHGLPMRKAKKLSKTGTLGSWVAVWEDFSYCLIVYSIVIDSLGLE